MLAGAAFKKKQHAHTQLIALFFTSPQFLKTAYLALYLHRFFPLSNGGPNTCSKDFGAPLGTPGPDWQDGAGPTP